VRGGAHLAYELFRTTAKLDMVHVPYKGAAQSRTELLGGQVQSTFAQPSVSLGHAKGGKLRILGVTSPKPIASWPDAQPIAQILPGFEATSWQGVVAPAKTPTAIVQRLYTEIVKALNAPDLKAKLAAESSEVGGMPPEQFGKFLANEIAKWKRVVKDANIKVES
jgi:tripartite-type tricarboxylate transporter receptor subunit TctC